MAKPKKRGAPRKAEKDKKTAHITVWMTGELKAQMSAAALLSGDPPGTWLRKLGEKAVKGGQS